MPDIISYSDHDHSDEDSIEEPIFQEAEKTSEQLIFEESLDKDLKIMIEKDIHRNRCKAKKIGSLILKPAL